MYPQPRTHLAIGYAIAPQPEPIYQYLSLVVAVPMNGSKSDPFLAPSRHWEQVMDDFAHVFIPVAISSSNDDALIKRSF